MTFIIASQISYQLPQDGSPVFSAVLPEMRVFIGREILLISQINRSIYSKYRYVPYRIYDDILIFGHI